MDTMRTCTKDGGHRCLSSIQQRSAPLRCIKRRVLARGRQLPTRRRATLLGHSGRRQRRAAGPST